MTTLPEYRVRAKNCSTDSENTIHADDAAREHGFRGGLVPGVVVYGYAVKPVIDFYGTAWLERGRMQIRFQQPVYDGDEVVVRAQVDTGMELTVSTDGVCAVAQAGLELSAEAPLPAAIAALPNDAERPQANGETLIPGTVLGALNCRLDSSTSRVFAALNEAPSEPAHPAVLLELSNRVLMRNFRLGPWLHVSSIVTNFSTVRDGAEVEARSRITGSFERKGHEFVVVEVVVLEGGRAIEHVTHTAIYS